VSPLEVDVGVRESLTLLVNSYIFKMVAMLKSSTEYNRRAVIIEGLRAGRSATEIIRFFEYPRSTVYDIVAKYTALEHSPTKVLVCHSKERNARIPRNRWKDSSTDFGWPRAIVAKINIDCWLNEATLRRIAEKDLWYKSYILKIRQPLWGCQDKPSCSPRLPFWSPNSPDLDPLDYYVWNVVERVTNKSRYLNVTSLRTAIEAAWTMLHYNVRANASDRE